MDVIAELDPGAPAPGESNQEKGINKDQAEARAPHQLLGSEEIK